MRKPFVPSSFKVPQKPVNLGNYYLAPVSTKDAVEDWLRMTASAGMNLRGDSKEMCPRICSLEENFKDLAWLELCAAYKQLFSYLLRDKKTGGYVGCAYIYPIEIFYPDLVGKYDVDFSFWITKEEYGRGTYKTIFKNLLSWLLKEWPFDKKRIYLRNKEIPGNLKQFNSSIKKHKSRR